MKIEMANLTFGYPRRLDGEPSTAIQDLSLTIVSGSFHAIVGPSGCGKTTLLRLIAGLEEPASGTVELVGQSRHRHAAAMVFESPRLLPWWTVERNVGIGLEFSNRSKELIERVRDFYTSHVGLGGLGKRMPDQLSLGQQSRAGLARALAHEADVLLLDEPFANLDAITRRRLHGEVEELWRADGRTTVMVTHDVEEAVLMSDRVSVMRAGVHPIVETIEVDAARPRFEAPGSLGADAPGIRSAMAHVWDALEEAAR